MQQSNAPSRIWTEDHPSTGSTKKAEVTKTSTWHRSRHSWHLIDKRQLLRTLAFETPAFRSLLFVDFIRLSQLYGDGGTSIWWWNKSLERRVLVLYYLSPSFRLYLIMWPIDNVDTSALHHVCVLVVVCSSSTRAALPSSICHRLVFILSVLHNSDIEMHAIQE